MSTYVIGDLHGCLDPLIALLDKLNYDPANDRLWFVGDLVNRGPQSLQTLRYIKALGDNATVVLGNHDLHCLGVMNGVRTSGPKDTLQDILDAPDRDELEHWLRHRSLLHHDSKSNTVMVHAGIPPSWTLNTAKKQARKIEKVLRADDYRNFLAQTFGNRPEHWRDADNPRRRRRFAVNALTRMRYCWSDGSLDFTFNAQPANRPEGLSPWYATPYRKPIAETIVFGHWSAHPAIAPPGIMPIDRGCVYGGCLVAYELEGRSFF